MLFIPLLLPPFPSSSDTPLTSLKMEMLTESGDLLSVFDELDPDTLSDGRVGLLGLDTDFLEDNSLSVGRTTEGRGLEGGSEKPLLEGLIGPATASTSAHSIEMVVFRVVLRGIRTCHVGGCGAYARR